MVVVRRLANNPDTAPLPSTAGLTLDIVETVVLSADTSGGPGGSGSTSRQGPRDQAVLKRRIPSRVLLSK